ncbi:MULTISPECIES: phosphatase PAP2 family protein [unclassified Arthrobacter]|uniref:phosphatase PAP2 family protein n=1 Tax=unclassified Arthrobacter TaxID=235627 RepID=UPI00254CEB69|nr:phosphatase PAP2 family protein [Arthrobacter sp. fls2-241-R2A-172]
MPALVPPGECPSHGDWSLPSNHAALALGAVWVIALATRRAGITWLAFGAAALVALGRVLQGVHYIHDVAFGGVLGLTIPAALSFVVLTLRERAHTQNAQN